LSEIPQIVYGKSCETISLETICQGFQDLHTVIGPALNALFKFDDIGADQPVTAVQHLFNALSGSGECVNPADDMGQLDIQLCMKNGHES